MASGYPLTRRGADFIVAASTASAKEKSFADYICDGTDDQVQIDEAITAAADHGGTVRLTGGVFNINPLAREAANDVTITNLAMTQNGAGADLDVGAESGHFAVGDIVHVSLGRYVRDSNTAASAGGDYLTTSVEHGLSPFQKIRIDKNGQTLTNVTADSPYYFVSTPGIGTRIKLATSRANVSAGTIVNIQSDVAGSLIVYQTTEDRMDAGYHTVTAIVGTVITISCNTTCDYTGVTIRRMPAAVLMRRGVNLVGEAMSSGNDKGTTLKLAAAANCDAIHCCIAANIPQFYTIADMMILGNATAQTCAAGQSAGIAGNSFMYDWQIQRVWTDLCLGWGVDLQEGWGLQICDTVIEYNQAGGLRLYKGGAAKIHSCKITGNEGPAQILIQDPSASVLMSGVESSSDNAASAAAIHMLGARYCTISGCRALPNASGAYGIILEGSYVQSTMYNTITGVVCTAPSGKIGILTTSGSLDNTIVGNYLGGGGTAIDDRNGYGKDTIAANFFGQPHVDRRTQRTVNGLAATSTGIGNVLVLTQNGSHRSKAVLPTGDTDARNVIVAWDVVAAAAEFSGIVEGYCPRVDCNGVTAGDLLTHDGVNKRAKTAGDGDMAFGIALTTTAGVGECEAIIFSSPRRVTTGSLSNAIDDVDTGQAIPVTASGYVPLVTVGGAETRTLAAPTFIGQELLLYLKTDGGDCVVTCATTVNQAGNNTITFAAAGDAIRLIGVESGANKRWRIASVDGAALSTVA